MSDYVSINNERSLYELLGISSDASPSEIKAAYRRLAKQYHPDINPSSEARSRMTEINEAYSILSNPAKRAAYDAGLGIGEERYEEYDESLAYAESFIQQVRCQGCGRFDHTLRVVAFPYVISILIMSFKRFEAGIFCHYCRSAKSTKWAAVSLLFGWWGVPFGVFWTIESLIVNLLKGKTPKEENQRLLKQLAWVNAVLGRIDEAKAALRDLLKYGLNEDARRFKDELDRSYPTIPPASVSGFRLGYFATVVAIIAMYIVVGTAIFGGPPENDTVNPPPAQSVPVTPTQPAPLIPPSDSFVKWQDSSGWLTETTVEIRGSVTNTHSEWAITNVRIEAEMLDKYGNVIQQHVVTASPSTIPPGGKGEYIEVIRVTSSCEDGSTTLHWIWSPPE